MPVQVRRRLGLQPGTVVLFEVQANGVLMRKGSTGQHPVDRIYGTLRLPRRVDDVLDEMRGPRLKSR